MDHETVNNWESALTPEQREQLAALRARKCRVEALFVPGNAAFERPSMLRLSVIVDHLLLASQDEEYSVASAFDAVYKEAIQRLMLPQP